jgi:hypothetical protein
MDQLLPARAGASHASRPNVKAQSFEHILADGLSKETLAGFGPAPSRFFHYFLK